MRYSLTLIVLGAILAAFAIWPIPASSGNCIGGNGFPFDFKCIAEVANFLKMEIPRDISCSFTVEIKFVHTANPNIKRATFCNNVLRFVTTSDLDMVITKEDLSFPLSNASQVVYQALGLSIDRSDPETKCTFYDSKGRVVTTPAPLLNMDAVLQGGPVPHPSDDPANEVWFDPQGPATQAVVLFHHPGKSRVFDCSFKLDFFLDPDQVAGVAAGNYEFDVGFIMTTDTDSEF